MRTFLAQGKANVPVNGAPAGTLAIYDSGASGTDDTPFVNPTAHLGRIAFHSALDYLGVVSETVTDVTLPASGSDGITPTSGTIALFAHGQGAPPLMLAQVSADGGANWFTINGTVYSEIGGMMLSRSLHIQADAGTIYLHWVALGDWPALALKIRVQVLARPFNAARPDTGEAFFASASAVRAAGGRFDTGRRYLQSPSAGQPATLRHTSGRTVFFADGDSGAEILIGFGNDINFGTITNINVGTVEAQIATRTQVPLVTGGNAALARALEISSSKRAIRGADGLSLFDSTRPVLSLVDEWKLSLSIPQRGAVDELAEVPHDVVHATRTVPAGTSVILGWIRINSTTQGWSVLSAMPTDFSGSVVLGGSRAIWGPTLSPFVSVRMMAVLSPQLVGDQLQIVESWFNQSVDDGPGFTPADVLTPGYTCDIHLFAAALTGGF